MQQEEQMVLDSFSVAGRVALVTSPTSRISPTLPGPRILSGEVNPYSSFQWL